MREPPPDSNVDSTAIRNTLRPAAAVAAGAVALAIGAFVLVAERNEPAQSHVAPFAATTNTNPAAAMDAPKPKFERSDEPAYEDSVQAHGG
jgi:hypothetical protein